MFIEQLRKENRLVNQKQQYKISKGGLYLKVMGR